MEPEKVCKVCNGLGYIWVETVDGDADADTCECLDLETIPEIFLGNQRENRLAHEIAAKL